MTVSAITIAASILLSASSSPALSEVLDFEGPTLLMAGAPSVPAGWERVIDTRSVALRDQAGRKRGQSLQHGEFPHYVPIRHWTGSDAHSGRKYLRISLSGAAARLRTSVCFDVERSYVYTLGGYYRYNIPQEAKVPGTGGSRTTILIEARPLNKEGAAMEPGRYLLRQAVPAGKSSWLPLPRIQIHSLPTGAVQVMLVLTVQTNDFAGWVEVDDLLFIRRPRIAVSTPAGSGVFTPGQTPSLHISASGLPQERLSARLLVRDYSGEILHERKLPVPTADGVYEAVQQLPHLGNGWFKAEIRISGSRGVPVAEGAAEFAVMPPTSRNHDIGLVLDPGEPTPAWVEQFRPGFVVVRMTAGPDLKKQAAGAAELIERVETRGSARYAWLDGSFREHELDTAIRALRRHVHAWIIPPGFNRERFNNLLEAAGVRRDILPANRAKGTLITGPEGEAFVPEETQLAIYRAPLNLAVPDVVWRTAELRAAGVPRIAYEFHSREVSPPPSLLAVAYWAPRLMEADFHGGSGIAPGVETLLLSGGRTAFLLFRTEKGRRAGSFTVAAGDSPLMRSRDLMGNARTGREGRPGLLDVDLRAGQYTSVLDGVDLGLLKTSMSVTVAEGRTIESRYRFQPLTISMENLLGERENMSAVLVPRLRQARGWDLKPPFTGKPVLVRPGEKAAFRFNLRPSFHATPGRYYLSLEIYPNTLSGGRFTVYKQITLHSPLRVSSTLAPAGNDSLALAVNARLEESFEGDPGVLDVGIRTPFGYSETLISGLIPGGRATAAQQFLLPSGDAAYPAELSLNDRASGLFYNSTIVVGGPRTEVLQR